MADLNSRLPDNKPGRFYVDSKCVDCDVCRDIAPDNFSRKAEKRYSFVYKQPENEEEEGLCREAMEVCPVEAIGNNSRC
jgi:ferredoxin